MKLVIAVLALVFVGGHASGHEVPVCPNDEGKDCETLEEALLNISSDSTLILEQGVHHLRNFTLVQGLQNVNITGMNSTGVIVNCTDGVGLGFINMTNLTISRITVDGCGLSGENLVKAIELMKQLIRNFYYFPKQVSFGLFFVHCEHLKMYQSNVTNTSGVGMVGINIIGQSQLSELNFSHNTQSGNCSEYITNNTLTEDQLRKIVDDSYKTAGGGLFLLYEDYVPALQSVYSQQQHSLEISNSTLKGNTECTFAYNFEFNYMFSSGFQTFDHGIGGSGGLTLVLAQLEYGINVSSTRVMFKENVASYGSGTHLTIYSGVSNSSVEFNNCTYLDNGVTAVTGLHDTSVVGCGGLSIINDVVLPSNISTPHLVHQRNVVVSIIDTHFERNKAPLIGALSVYSLFTSPISDLTDVVRFLIQGCKFIENESFVGSALGVVEQKFSGRNIGIQTTVKNSSFTNNTIATGSENVAVPISQSVGIIDLQNVNLTLEGDCFFLRNDGTAIRGQQVTISIDGNTLFEGNIGIYGGALHLEEYSYLVPLKNSTLSFKANTGRVNGGAMFVDFLGAHNSPRLSGGYIDCFLLFDYDFAGSGNLTNINSTDVYIEFNGNLAPTGSIIYGSSLSTCYWTADLQLKNPNLTVFEILGRDYPNVFNFTDEEPMGLNNVGTPARWVTIDDKKCNYVASPGEVFTLNISAYDNFKQNIPNVIQSYVSSEGPQILKNSTTKSLVGNNTFALLNGTEATMVSARVIGKPPQSLTVIVYSTDNNGQASSEITVELVDCSVGFVLNENNKCVCDPRFENKGILCNTENQTLLIPEPLWIGPIHSNSSRITVHSCMTGLCKRGDKILKVYPDLDQIDFDSQCAERFNRGRLLCGSCRSNFSVSLGSLRCMECSNGGIALIILFLALGIFLVIAISFLQITITAGYINGVIFYANILSLYIPILAPSAKNYGRYFFVFFITLNFGIETCFHSGLTDIYRVVWQLTFPLYLFILMFMIKCFAQRKWFNRGRAVGFSTIRAFATLSILCYVSVLESSVELLGGVTLTSIDQNESYTGWITDPSVSYFKGIHGFLTFVAVMLMIFYVIPLPIFLLFPRLLYRVKYLRKLKPFYDAFYDPFEPSTRFWLGFRLISRWVPFVLAYTVLHPINSFITAMMIVILLFLQLAIRPFKGMWRNLIDSLFLALLIFHFMGEVFFEALESRQHNATRDILPEYTTGFYVLAFLLFIAIVLFHIYLRFPKLQQCCRRRQRTRTVRARPSNIPSIEDSDEAHDLDGDSYEDIDQLAGSLIVNASEPQTPVVYQASELRESLLDDLGSVEVMSVEAKECHIETRKSRVRSLKRPSVNK